MKKNKRSSLFTITEASHPIPNEAGVEGAKRILKVVQKAKENDLVVVLISGGGSALMPLPAPGNSLQDKQKITALLLQSGASIQEINIVRKHLSLVKGGQMLRSINESCKVISIIISDVIDDDLASIASGPTSPDCSTFKHALDVLRKYNLADELDAVTKYIMAGVNGKIRDTPKSNDPIFSNVDNIIIGNNSSACQTGCNFLQKRGLNAVHLGSRFDGEAKKFGAFLAQLGSDLKVKNFAIVAGGETTVRLNKARNGLGGRNQEAALAFAIGLDRTDIATVFVGTDGIDGNSDAAGGIISSKTSSLYKRSDMQKYLGRHDSYHVLKRMHSLIFTGYTGTNVNDIAIMVCSPKASSKRKNHQSVSFANCKRY